MFVIRCFNQNKIKVKLTYNLFEKIARKWNSDEGVIFVLAEILAQACESEPVSPSQRARASEPDCVGPSQ